MMIEVTRKQKSPSPQKSPKNRLLVQRRALGLSAGAHHRIGGSDAQAAGRLGGDVDGGLKAPIFTWALDTWRFQVSVAPGPSAGLLLSGPKLPEATPRHRARPPEVIGCGCNL